MSEKSQMNSAARELRASLLMKDALKAIEGLGVRVTNLADWGEPATLDDMAFSVITESSADDFDADRLCEPCRDYQSENDQR